MHPRQANPLANLFINKMRKKPVISLAGEGALRSLQTGILMQVTYFGRVCKGVREAGTKLRGGFIRSRYDIGPPQGRRQDLASQSLAVCPQPFTWRRK